MKTTGKCIASLFFAVCMSIASPVYAAGAGIEWAVLNDEAMSLYEQGNYQKAIIVAKEALQVAKENAGNGTPMLPPVWVIRHCSTERQTATKKRKN